MQPVHPPSMAGVLVYLDLGSLEAVELACDQRRLWSDCADAQAYLSLGGRMSLIVEYLI